MRGREWNATENNPDFRDARVAEVARGQHGVVSTAQLRAAGLGAEDISYRVAIGRLHPLFLCAFAVGHRALTRDGWFTAALLALGDDAALGFFSACQHLGVWEGRVGKVHVVLPRRARHRDLIQVHSVQSMPPCVTVRGIRVVAPATAVLQFAAAVRDLKAIRRVAREAQFLRIATHDELVALCDEHAGARGAERLRRALAGGAARTRNGGEDKALEFLRWCGLDPETNAELFGFEPDFYLPEHNLVIEFDGRGVHDIPIVAAEDRRRQAVYEAGGVRVLRIDMEDITTFREQTRRRVLAATAT